MRDLMLAAIIGSGITMLLGVAIFFVAVPYFQLQAKRRASWEHIPQPGEIWMQDGDMLYIESVGPNGVEIMAVDGGTKVVTKWHDKWDDWQRRLHTNTIFYTGQQRQLQVPE